MILSREQIYLDLMFSADEPNTYNILKVTGFSLGNCLESIAKCQINKGENNSMFGRTGENHHV